MRLDESQARTLELLWGTRSGNYPKGTTAEALAEVVLGKKFATYVKSRSYWKAAKRLTVLHLAAWERHLPSGTTPQVLINAKDYLGFTALHTAACTGVLPPETTVAQLIQTRGAGGLSALHFVPYATPYFSGVTKRDLIDTRNDLGWSALHASATAGNLIEGTTLLDLLKCTDKFGNSALAALPKELGFQRIKPVLDATAASSIDELEQLGKLTCSRNPAAVAIWMSTELMRLQKLNRV